MYPKTVTEQIIYYQALGFTAEETRQALKDKNNLDVSINTVYNHRRSPLGQEMIEELIRQQERDILKADSDNKALAMKYRNELLKMLLPQRIEQKIEGQPVFKVEIVDNSKQDNPVSDAPATT